MAKYTRFDPRNKNKGRNKTRSLGKDFKIRDAENTKNIHKYKGTKINWIVDETVEVDEDTDAQLS
jgi:hypothetical protein